jgi:hypothetical protein
MESTQQSSELAALLSRADYHQRNVAELRRMAKTYNDARYASGVTFHQQRLRILRGKIELARKVEAAQ